MEQKHNLPKTELFINGKFVPPSSKTYFDSINPATEEAIAHIASAGEQDVNAAVAAARAAFDTPELWSGLTGKARAKYLVAIADELTKAREFLAPIETSDCGKALKETLMDVDDSAATFRYFATKAEELDAKQGTPIPLADKNFACELRYFATGVVAAIIPWNYPLLMMSWKVAPALAAGCTIVLKPSELTSLTALEFAKITNKVGLPAGVFNVVTGAGETGGVLSNHPDIDKIAFTGSVPTGSKVAAAAAKHIKRCTLELGGKSPLIVFDDVDIPKAVEWAMFGCFFTNGQICSATSRLLVHSKIAEKFLDVLKRSCEAIPVVNPNLKENADLTGILGPLVSENQWKRVRGYIDGAVKEGATVLCGGKVPQEHKKGFYLQPTVLLVTPKMTVWKEEIFGPVLSVVQFNDEKEAIRLANDSEFGLGGGVISADPHRCTRVSNALRCGIVWINCSQPCFVDAPWGGCKKSGVGRELGPNGMDIYLEPKQVTTFLGTDPWGWYNMSKL